MAVAGGLHRVVHRLTVAEQVRHAAVVLDLERVGVRARVEALHDAVEVVRVERVDEVQHRRTGGHLALELQVLDDVRGGERRRADPGEVLGQLLVVEQLRPGHAHQLETDAEDAVVVQVGGRERPGTGEADPCPKRGLGGEHTTPKVIREVRQHAELTPHHAVGLGVPRPLGMPVRVVVLREALHLLDDRPGDLLLVREHLLLGQPQRRGLALEVDQGLDDGLDRRPKQPVEPVAEVRVDPAFEEQEPHQGVVDDPPEPGGRHGLSGAQGVLVHRSRARWRSAAIPGRKK